MPDELCGDLPAWIGFPFHFFLIISMICSRYIFPVSLFSSSHGSSRFFVSHGLGPTEKLIVLLHTLPLCIDYVCLFLMTFSQDSVSGSGFCTWVNTGDCWATVGSGQKCISILGN